MTDVHLQQRHATMTPADLQVAAPDRPARRSDPAVLCECLAAQHPDVDPALIERIVHEAWDDSARFRVKDFRAVLVERAAQHRLRILTGGTP